MHNNDHNEASESEFAAWLDQVGGVHGRNEPCEESIIAFVCDAIREPTPRARAQYWIDAANMCMAMADKTLGAQGNVATSVVLVKH